MNNVSPERKQTLLKSLAVAGVIGSIVFLAWLSIQLISYAPSAFSSLASLAENVYSTSPTTTETFTVTTNKSVVTSGEPITLTWAAAGRNGSYVFRYECTDGVAIDIVSDEQALRSISCDTNYNVGNATDLTLNIESEKNRFIDVPYSVAFLRTNDMEPRAESAGRIAVTNPQLSGLASAGDETGADDAEETLETSEPSGTASSEDNDTAEPGRVAGESDAADAPTSVTPAVTYEQQFVYEVPASDPNGRTDLAVRMIGVGELFNERTFFESGVLTGGEQGAVQFEVKNLGTKTSGEWDYTLSLPNGQTHEGTDQEPLRPNERAVLTLAFPVPENGTSEPIFVEVTAIGDRTAINDRAQLVATIE